MTLPGVNRVGLRSYNVRYDSATLLFSFDVVVGNLLSEPIGTPDGLMVSGIKVFFDSGPTATSFVAPYATGAVSVANADGRQSFTKPNQPYYFYNQILLPHDSTPPKRWQLRVPGSVNTFSFAVKVFTRVSSEPAIPMDPWGSEVPARYLAAESLRDCNVAGAARCVRDGVMIRFQLNATEEQRLSATNLVGTYEGAAGGLYFVRLPTDSTMGTLVRAISNLQSLPQVRAARPYFPSEVQLNY